MLKIRIESVIMEYIAYWLYSMMVLLIVYNIEPIAD